MIERYELQKVAHEILRFNGVPQIHIPNRVFRPGFKAPEDLKSFPDILFAHSNRFYFWEFWIRSSGHGDRKELQWQRAGEWVAAAPVISERRIIETRAELVRRLRGMGMRIPAKYGTTQDTAL